jgi:2,3-dihydroxy-p-cumate/2,3-dihydroxybenzoate 3,4-dioxygenase
MAAPVKTRLPKPPRQRVVFEYSSGVKSIADELLYRERQFPSEPKGFCYWGAEPRIRQFQE